MRRQLFIARKLTSYRARASTPKAYRLRLCMTPSERPAAHLTSRLSHAICAPPVPVTAAARIRAALGRSHDDAGPSSRGERNPRPACTFSRNAAPAARARSRPHGERHPRAGDGRGRAGEVRPSRPADGRGRYRDRAVHPLPQIRSGRSGLARPRPLRALGRPRLDAALRAALSHSATRR